MTATCDFVGMIKGTRWSPSAIIPAVAPGVVPTAPSARINLRNPGLVVGLWALAQAPFWTPDVLRVAHVIKDDQALQKDQQPMPASILWDAAGFRFLPEPIPLRADEYVSVYVVNDDTVARNVSVGAEIVELSSAELDRYVSDADFRAAVIEQIRANRCR